MDESDVAKKKSSFNIDMSSIYKKVIGKESNKDSPTSAKSNKTSPFREPLSPPPIRLNTSQDINKKKSNIINKVRERSNTDTGYIPLRKTYSTNNLFPKFITLNKTASSLQPDIINKVDNPDLFNISTTINTVVRYIVNNKLNLSNINYDNYINIFKDNLIFNFGILISQNSEDIKRLKLPLALETETKLLIDSNKKNKTTIISFNQITTEVKIEIKTILNTIIKSNYYRNILFDIFYDKLFEADDKYKQMLNLKGLNFKSKKLFKIIKLMIDFLDDPTTTIKNFELVIISHLINDIKENDYNIHSRILTDCIYILFKDKISNNIKDCIYITINELSLEIMKHYDVIKKGKNYYLYFKKNKRWHKCHSIITHNKLIIYRYSNNELVSSINIKDLHMVELVEQGDIRIIKQTDYCIKLSFNNKNENYYICADDEDNMRNIYDDIGNRLQIFENLTDTNNNNKY